MNTVPSEIKRSGIEERPTQAGKKCFASNRIATIAQIQCRNDLVHPQRFRARRACPHYVPLGAPI